MRHGSDDILLASGFGLRPPRNDDCGQNHCPPRPAYPRAMSRNIIPTRPIISPIIEPSPLDFLRVSGNDLGGDDIDHGPSRQTQAPGQGAGQQVDHAGPDQPADRLDQARRQRRQEGRPAPIAQGRHRRRDGQPLGHILDADADGGGTGPDERRRRPKLTPTAAPSGKLCRVMAMMNSQMRRDRSRDPAGPMPRQCHRLC